MTMADVKRLGKGAAETTHLARFERAHLADASCVLEVDCPDCGARARHVCTPWGGFAPKTPAAPKVRALPQKGAKGVS